MMIGKREIFEGRPPYFIAEIGANHGGYIERAYRLIESAKAAGANAVKFQAYTADTITIESDRDEFRLKEGPWKGWKLYDLYKKAETPFDWFPRLAKRAKACRIDWIASAFDQTAVDMLDELDCAAIKIASFEIIDTPLIRYAAATGRPVIISTGMATDDEVDHAVGVVHYGLRKNNYALLHCVSGYPTPVDQARLDKYWMLRRHRCPFGISDHSIGLEIPVAATALGATIIEKHFTLDLKWSTPDSAFSMKPLEFRQMVDACNGVWKAIQVSGEPESERAQRPLRRSLWAVKPIAAGEPFTRENVRSIRPGGGLAPDMIETVLRHKALIAIPEGTPLKESFLGEENKDQILACQGVRRVRT